MIQIYSPTNTDYTHNGDQTLMPSSATVHVILNGSWTAELTHPIDADGRWKSIVKDAVIKMPSFNGDQLFRIKSTSKSDSGVTASMEPIFMDSMGDCFLVDIRPTAKNGQQALNDMVSPNSKYSASSDITRAATAYYEYKNLIEAIAGDDDNAFLKRWGGEILYDNFTVIINERAGGDYGVEVRYGKNIPQDGVTEEVDASAVITRIYPKAYNGYTMTNHGYVDSPLISSYPTIKATTLTFDDVKMAADAQEDDAENGIIICNSQAELDQALTQKCQEQYDAGLDKPTVSLDISMVLLQNTEQYKDYQILETVSLGDTIHCRDSHLDIISDTRVIELEYDAIQKRASNVVIGEAQYNYFNQVTDSANRIEQVVRPDGTLMAERVQGILNGIYTQLRLQSTAAQKVNGSAFLVEDTDQESALYGAMVWGTQGLQISTTRTADGRGWDWTTAVTANGIVANTIITGILSDREGKNYWNLDTGEFRLSAEAFQIDDQTVKDYVDGEIDNKIAQIRTLTMQLSNEFTGVPTDANGSGGDYTDCYTDVFLMIGTTDITDSTAVQYAVNPSAGVTGNWNASQKRYTVTYLSGDTGTVSITASYSGLMVTKVFTITKVKQGQTGAQGVPGPAGNDGQTLYTWIKYADTPTSGMSDSPDGKEYMGIAYNKTTPTESTNYSDYQWSLVKGANGSQGIPGPAGEDGQTLYTWNKYATSATGANMSDDPDGKTYLGIAYNKATATESNDPDDYTWAFFEGPQGPKGEQGIPGSDGTDGRTSYFHIKYSVNSNGNPMTETPSTYIGTYVDFAETDSTDYRDYTWSRFQGAQGPQGTQGIPGINGENGQTSYLHIKYSNDGGASFTSNNGETPGKYIGQYVDFTQADSTDPDRYTWSLTQGADGRVYQLQASTLVIKQGADNAYNPPSVTFSAYYRDGTTASRTAYAGRFVISESIDGTSYTTKYTSSRNESSHTYTPSSTNIKNIRCILYAAGGTSSTLDMQGVAIVRDVDNLTQQEVFNILTNNGATQGIYLQDGRLYINATYIGTGTIASKDGKSSWNLDAGVLIVGDENSRINAGILQSPNFVSGDSGIQINLNSGVVQGEIEATSLSAKDNIKLYNDGKEHIFVTGNYSTDGMIITTIGCDLENYSTTERAMPSINLNKSGTASLILIDASEIQLDAPTSVGGTLSVSGAITAFSAITASGTITTDSFFRGSSIGLYDDRPAVNFHYNNSSSTTSRITAAGTGRLEIGYGGQYGGIIVDSTGGYVLPSTQGNFSLGMDDVRFYKLWVTNGVDNSSLAELKTDIKPFQSALAELDKTDVYNYKLKSAIERDGDDIVRTGFVIGDGCKLSKYLLGESGEGIELYNAIGVAFGALKEMYEIIKKQGTQIKDLESKLIQKG